MIKLNNKNITYVALADSNNSVKGVKEVWYADTNNSVKLVYRRKDTLIEGEDYEKYHWLKGDGSAYINTNVKNLTDVHCIDILLSVDGVVSGNHFFFGRESVAPYYNSQITLYYITQRQWLSIWADSTGHGINFVNKVGDVIINLDTNIASTSTGSTEFSISNYNSAFPIFLFSVNYNGTPTSQFIGKIKKLEIDNILYLTPCKLLKPVPKWLDANGIRRQVGECGMIDLVSGKFYGNVNSVGTFTVENYYERKEWLIGDGTAYIDTGIIVDVPTLHYNLETVLNTIGTLCGSRNANGSNSSSISVFTPTRLRLDIFDTNTYADFSGGVIDVDVPNKVITINDVPFTTTRTNFGNANYSFRIFDLYYRNNYNDVPCGTMKIHYFSITDNSHNLSLIPCTLTMDLPASMDANNIARTKGTSGMWDLVSDRFYGNVANSGTFKAVNLAEGVDYEVHQWLKGDLSSYIKLDNHYNTDELAYIETVAQLYDNSTPHVAIIIGNNNSDDNGGYCLRMTFNNPQDLCDAHRRGNGHQDSVRNLFNNDYGVHTYYLSLNDFIVDGVSYPFTYGSRFDDIMDVPYTRVVFGSTKFNSIKLRANNTTFSLIPVKLLKSIPAKYDGNGIARQVGECGMYDTINDLFYGNVASSGTLSVSDDS